MTFKDSLYLFDRLTHNILLFVDSAAALASEDGEGLPGVHWIMFQHLLDVSCFSCGDAAQTVTSSCTTLL